MAAAKEKPKALIWLESAVGSGHVKVTCELTRALQARGWDVTVFTSGRQFVKNYDFGDAKLVHPEPLRLGPNADPYDINSRVTPSGGAFKNDNGYREQRKKQLLDLYHALKPDAVITEMWPYGRTSWDFELIPLAEAVKADAGKPNMIGRNKNKPSSPQLYSLTRDIMLPRRENTYTVEPNDLRHAMVRQFFKPGTILVRGDGRFLPLDRSLGKIPSLIQEYINYAGYIVDTLPDKTKTIPEKEREILIASGGGITSDSLTLYEKAIEAYQYSKHKDRNWRIIIPESMPESEFQQFCARAAAVSPDGHVIVERYRPGLHGRMVNAALLVAHGGYNTVVEAVTANVPTLIVPRQLTFYNREQGIRAEVFEEKGLLKSATIPEIQNNARLFAEKMDEAMVAPRRKANMKLDGAARMAEIINRNHIQEQSPGRRR